MKRAGKLAACWLLALALLPVFTSAGFTFTLQGETHYVSATQMWYEGYWKPVGWINGTTKRWPTTDSIEGHIVLLDQFQDWRLIEPAFRSLAAMKPLALLYAVPNGTEVTPGISMYTSCDGKDRKPINYPIAEVLVGTGSGNWTALPDGTWLEVYFESNPWKEAFDTHFQTIIGALLSLWEICIVIFGSLRLYQFYLAEERFTPFSIGPLCIIFEILSSLVRFSHTIVDPFWNARIYSTTVQFTLLTFHLPFAFASGILLSFFWAETLTKSNLKATPFISRYKKLSIGVLVFLFVLEIAETTIRAFTSGMVYAAVAALAVIVYFFLSIIIGFSFIACAIAIWRRLAEAGARKHDAVRSLTIRFGFSIVGYFSLSAFLAAVVSTTSTVWVFSFMLNLLYISVNWIGTLQLLALRPITIRYTKTTTGGSKERTAGRSFSSSDTKSFAV